MDNKINYNILIPDKVHYLLQLNLYNSHNKYSIKIVLVNK